MYARWHHVVMKPWLRQGIWLVAALIVPVLLSLALLPLRDHVSDVLIALVLLTVSAAAVARGELLLSLVAAASTALSFDYFFTMPYDQFAIRSAQGVVTTVALIAAVPALGTWIGRLYGKEAARERELREKAERYAEELAERQRQVEQLAAELTASRRRILAVGDEMRRRIERDLHDGVQQRLVTLSLMLRGIRDRVPADVRAMRTRYAMGWPARSRSSGISPAACIRPSSSRPASGRPSARWPGAHRSRSGCRCRPTAGSPARAKRPRITSLPRPSPTPPSTRRPPRWTSSSNGPTAR